MPRTPLRTRIEVEGERKTLTRDALAAFYRSSSRTAGRGLPGALRSMRQSPSGPRSITTACAIGPTRPWACATSRSRFGAQPGQRHPRPGCRHAARRRAEHTASFSATSTQGAGWGCQVRRYTCTRRWPSPKSATDFAQAVELVSTAPPASRRSWPSRHSACSTRATSMRDPAGSAAAPFATRPCPS